MHVKLHFIEKGFGEPFVLLHSNGADHTYFNHQIDFFSREFHIIAIDTRGHGQSPRGTAPFTITQFAEDLYLFLKEQNIEKTHLLGFSDGANVALVFALKYPQMLDKLVLNGANLNTSAIKRTVQIPIELGYKIAKFFARRNPKAISNAEMLGLMVNEPNIDKVELRKVTNRTLVIAGTNDIVKKSHTQLIYESLPNAEFVFVKGNHFIANKNPQEFNEKVMDFLKCSDK